MEAWPGGRERLEGPPRPTAGHAGGTGAGGGAGGGGGAGAMPRHRRVEATAVRRLAEARGVRQVSAGPRAYRPRRAGLRSLMGNVRPDQRSKSSGGRSTGARLSRSRRIAPDRAGSRPRARGPSGTPRPTGPGRRTRHGAPDQAAPKRPDHRPGTPVLRRTRPAHTDHGRPPPCPQPIQGFPPAISGARDGDRGAHRLLHGRRGRDLRRRLDHTPAAWGRLRIRGHVVGADEVAAHAYARRRGRLRRSPLLPTAALARAGALAATPAPAPFLGDRS